MRFYLPLCLLDRHRPDRPRVKWDGTHFVGRCRFCRRPIRRREQGQWKRDWLDRPAP